MGVNSLPKTVTRQRRGCDLNPGPTAPESSTLTTRLPSHPSSSSSRGNLSSIGNMPREPCKNRGAGRDFVWGVDFRGPRNNYSHGRLAPSGEHDRMIRARQRCGLMSNYFDHLLLLFVTSCTATKPKLLHARRQNLRTTQTKLVSWHAASQ